MENLMSMFNPEMMKGLMENEELQKMMNDPNVMSNLQNMMGNSDLFGGAGVDAEAEAGSGATCDVNGECEEGSKCCEPEEDLELEIEDLDGMELEESEIELVIKFELKDYKI